MTMKDAKATYGASLSTKQYEMATLVQHSETDNNGDKFICGVADHMNRFAEDAECNCYCSHTGQHTIWHQQVRHAEEISLGLTSARCKCLDNWTFNGRQFSGCQNPLVAGEPLDANMPDGGWRDTHGHAPHDWCMVQPGSCHANRIPAGNDWDTCELDAHFKTHVTLAS